MGNCRGRESAVSPDSYAHMNHDHQRLGGSCALNAPPCKQIVRVNLNEECFSVFFSIFKYRNFVKILK